MTRKLPYRYKAIRENILYIDSNNCILQRKNFLIFNKINKCKIPYSFLNCFFAKFNITRRIFRLNIRSGCFYKGNFIFGIKNKIYFWNIKSNIITVALEMNHFSRPPLKFEYVSNSKNYNDGIYFGEYGQNDEKRAMNIYFSQDGIHFKTVFSFKKDMINHIHCICYDKTNDKMYACTGDTVDSSNIWEIYKNFTIKPLFKKNIYARTCNLFFLKNNIYFCTDYPDDDNYLCKINGKNEIEKLFPINGSCINSISLNSFYYFSTAVEPHTVYKNKWDFYLTNKKGSGIHENKCFLYEFDGVSLRKVFMCENDCFPLNTFQFANLVIPSQCLENQLIFFANSVKKVGGKTIFIER